MTKTVDTLLEQNPEVLYTVQGVFPFTLKPSTLIIDKTKILFYERFFPIGHSIQTMAVSDISSVIVETAFPFASLRIFNKFYVNEPIVITHIPDRHAKKARRIIDGLVLANREGIDVVAAENSNLPNKLEAIGSIPPLVQ
jgi:hypothetical protein